jgi:cytochrome c5
MRRVDTALVLMLAAATTVAVLGRASGTAAAEVAPRHARPGTAAYAEGAPPGFSGGFSEQSCHACHFHGEVNSGPERVTIAGAPERFEAGETYALTVTLRRPDMKVAGFQLTARFKDDGAQAGMLAIAPADDARVKVETQGGVQYVNQRKEGTALAEAHTSRWSVSWTAPDAARPVVFHVAANAGDGDGTAEGDYVETATVETMPAK